MKKDTIAKILILLFGIFYLSGLGYSCIIKPDDASSYILLGKSLSLGLGYKAIWSVGNPPYTKAPFILPILLMPIIYFFGYNFLIMQLIGIITAIGSLWVVYLLFKRISDESMALSIMILTGFSSQFFYYSQQILTEIPYLFFSFLVIFIIEKSKYEKKLSKTTLALAAFFILVSYFTRVIGISLLVAFLMYILFERRPNKDFWPSLGNVISLCFLMLIPIILWELRTYNLRGIEGFDYIKEFLFTRNPLYVFETFNIFERIIRSIYAYVFYAYPKILTGVQFSHRNPIAFMLTTTTFCGFLHCLFKRRMVFEYYVILYMTILLFWSWSISSGTRFLVPLVPLVFYYFIIGLRKISEVVKLTKGFREGFLIFIVVALLLFNIKESFLLSLDEEYMCGHSQEEVDNFLDIVKWVKHNTSCESILGCSFGAPIYLYFERKTAVIPCYVSSTEAMDIIKDNKVDYVIITPIFTYSKQYLEPIIVKNIDKFIEVYRRNENIVYKVKGL